MSAHLAEQPLPPPSNDNPASLPSRSGGRRRRLSYFRNHSHTIAPALSQALPQSSTTSHSQPNILTRSSSQPLEHTNVPEQPGTTFRFNRNIGTSSEEKPQASEDQPSPVTANTSRTGFSRIMARHRAGSTPHGSGTPQANQTTPSEAQPVDTKLAGYPHDHQMPTIRLIPHQDTRAARPSLLFPPTSRTLPHEDCVIRVGRYSERDTNPNPPPNIPSSAPVGFKSKVVSRRHCEFWCSNGQWYIKDVKSSSGTFLNHIRLSAPSVESRPFPVNDGDVVQLGIDFRGGEEMIFRCVKIRVECNRAWQKSLNNFNVTTHKRLRELAKAAPKNDSDGASTHSSECSICLMSIAPCQSLFVAPCSHVWHYKCIRPILNDHKTWPQFLCPNCRAVADLEADVDDPNGEGWDDEEHDTDLRRLETPEGSALLSTNEVNGNDIDLASATSRHLSIRNGADGSPISPATPMEVLPDPNHSSTSLSRRNARRISPPQGGLGNGSPFSPSHFGNTNEENPAFGNYLRPITPVQPLMRDEDMADNESPPEQALTPNASEILIADGPMTPTNNAGPFVFDGSAGRAAGRRAAESMETDNSA